MATALLLAAGHFLAWAWVSWQNVQYDSGNILWWMVAFLVLPAAALVCILTSAARGALGLRKNGERK